MLTHMLDLICRTLVDGKRNVEELWEPQARGKSHGKL